MITLQLVTLSSFLFPSLLALKLKEKNFNDRYQAFTLTFGEKLTYLLHGKLGEFSKKWFTPLFLLFMVMIFTFVGALFFMLFEGTRETVLVEKILEERQRAINKLKELVNSGSGQSPDAVMDVVKSYEEVLGKQLELDSKVMSKGDDQNNWDFWGSAFYCGTVYTLTGISAVKPLTVGGRVVTIVYTAFGIPLFLILLADFGKFLMRWIKYLWIHVRRIYYTGSCKKSRRRESDDGEDDDDEDEENMVMGIEWDEEIDDFTLPVSLAISVFIIYLLIGTVVYFLWEQWTFLDSFYFVFITMATIGFGDIVPTTPASQMFLILYLTFGLALTSMCVHVGSEYILDTFTRATAKVKTATEVKEVDLINRRATYMTQQKVKEGFARSPSFSRGSFSAPKSKGIQIK